MRVAGLAFAAAVLPAFLARCADDPAQASPPLPSDLTYTVSIPSMGLDSLGVTLDIRYWPGDTICLIAPPLYADNPLPRSTGPNFRNIRVVNSAGDSIAVAFDSVDIGLTRCLRMRFTAPLPAQVSYHVGFDYEPYWGLPLLRLGATSGYLQGNYVFAMPVAPGALSTAAIWRAPWDINVQYELGPGVTLWGDPTPVSVFRNAYALMFSTSAIGGELLAQESEGGQQFRIVNVQDTSYSSSTVSRVTLDFAKITSLVTSHYGTIGAPLTMILGANSSGGLEGMYAFTIINPWDTDTHGVFNMVAAHELVHCWVGVRTGDLYDPWWKEGTTNYLGFVYTRQLGLSTRELFAWQFLADLSDSADVRDYALSDPRMREYLFAREPALDMIDLAYRKGGQVSMILDLRLRTASDNQARLDVLVGEFVQGYRAGAFGRAEYVSFLERRSGASLGEFFARYVDSAGAVPVDYLAAVEDSLVQLGAFDRWIPAPPVSGSVTHIVSPARRW